MSLQQHVTEAAVTKAATTAQYAGSSTAVAFGMTGTEWSVIGVVGGLIVAILGFAVNWFYKERHYRLAQEKSRGWSALDE